MIANYQKPANAGGAPLGKKSVSIGRKRVAESINLAATWQSAETTTFPTVACAEYRTEGLENAYCTVVASPTHTYDYAK